MPSHAIARPPHDMPSPPQSRSPGNGPQRSAQRLPGLGFPVPSPASGCTSLRPNALSLSGSGRRSKSLAGRHTNPALTMQKFSKDAGVQWGGRGSSQDTSGAGVVATCCLQLAEGISRQICTLDALRRKNFAANCQLRTCEKISSCLRVGQPLSHRAVKGSQANKTSWVRPPPPATPGSDERHTKIRPPEARRGKVAAASACKSSEYSSWLT